MKLITLDINWPVLIIVGALLLALVIFLIATNKKDKRDLEHQLNEDYPKPGEDEHTDDPDEVKNN